MKKLLFKMIPVIGIAFFLTSVFSCSSDNGDDLPIYNVTVPINLHLGKAATDQDIALLGTILEELKTQKYIESYTATTASAVSFSQKGVKKADEEKVLAELTAKAHDHYTKAREKVNNFNFNTLTPNDLAAAHVWITTTIEKRSYDIDVKIQKPLIWDKKWITNVADCPIQEISFKNLKEPIATLRMKDGTTDAEARRASGTRIVIQTTSDAYLFDLNSTTEMQLVQVRPLSSSKPGPNIKDQNYIFKHKL